MRHHQAPRGRGGGSAAVGRFGRIDVLVNNAANFFAGYFEELTPEQMDRQLATSLIGPMNVTRAVLPVMREQRSAQIIAISSSAGLAGFEFGSAYAASKFGLEGWMESLAPEVAPFGTTTTIVDPGFFRTELLTEQSTNFAEFVYRRLQRAASEAAGILEISKRQTGRRPRQARAGVLVAEAHPFAKWTPATEHFFGTIRESPSLIARGRELREFMEAELAAVLVEAAATRVDDATAHILAVSMVAAWRIAHATATSAYRAGKRGAALSKLFLLALDEALEPVRRAARRTPYGTGPARRKERPG